MNASTYAWLRWFGMFGSAALIGTSLIAALAYRGRAGERYSPLNHFISELGEVGVSRLARVFNAGLVAGGVLLVPFFIGLGLELGTVLGWVGAALGVAAVLSCAAVGLLPMNNLKPHARAAMTFFRLGLLAMLVFGTALLAQPRGAAELPRFLGLAALLGSLTYAAFMLAARRAHVGARLAEGTAASHAFDAPLDAGDERMLDPLAVPSRPRVWLVPALEWAIYAANILWFLLTASAWTL